MRDRRYSLVTKLPSLQTLRYFEVAARFESFLKAAEELNISPGAVSRQVKLLEQLLGQQLFERGTRNITLTPAGRRLSEATDLAMQEVAKAVRDIQVESTGQSVHAQVGPFFSARWLMPRLPDFLRRHPDIDIRLHHSLHGDTPGPAIDLAIRWGSGDWTGGHVEPLLDVTMQPVAKPGITIGEGGPTLPLMHVRDRSDWREWLSAAGYPSEWSERGPIFDEANVAMEAAAGGAGIVLDYSPLHKVEIESGRLASCHPFTAPCTRRYYCFLPAKPERIGLSAGKFYRWLLAQR